MNNCMQVRWLGVVMRKLVPVAVLTALAATTAVWGQVANKATLAGPSGTHEITYVEQNGETLLLAEEAAIALGGRVSRDNRGYRVFVGKGEAAFGTDSRYAVVGEDLFEMPTAPSVIEGRAYVPWQFFQALARQTLELDLSWNAATRTFTTAPLQRQSVSATVSVVQIEDLTKVVLELSAPAEYTIARQPNGFTFRFKNPIRAPFTERPFENPHVRRVTFSGSDVHVELTGSNVVGDPYRLDNPFRIVLDLRTGTGALQPSGSQTPTREQQRPRGIRTIVLDPGHGGKEIGAIGPGGLVEKDATLAICQLLSPMLAKRLGARVILTRDDDAVVALEQRTTLANQYNADLFLSVHVNASLTRTARGSETYFLSLEASDELARKAAEHENAAATSAAADRSDLRLILWDLAQQDYLRESSRLAELIQGRMSVATGVENRGVKQAPFKVLVGATMPAALVEVGFISNPDEEAKLRDPKFLESIAAAIAGALEQYKNEYEVRIGLITPPPPAQLGAAPPASAPTQPVPAPASPSPGGTRE